MPGDERKTALNQDRPIFIIGGSRTGSEMLKTMLSASPEIDFVDEAFFHCPRWLHKDLATNIREHVGSLEAEDAVDKLVELLYSGIPYGWLWSEVEQELDRGLLRAELSNGALTQRSILASVMNVHALMRGKTGVGAKFPVHYSMTKKLLEWFPECRLIHTTRSPKDVYASQAAKYTTSSQNWVSRNFSRLQHFVHINIQTAWTARCHLNFQTHPNYRLVRYEDVVTNPEESIRDLCEFLDVPFIEQMLEPNQYGSSYGNKKERRGIATKSIGRWREKISPAAAKLMDIAHRRAYRILGYDVAQD